jgi:hypothetical protein
VAVAQGVVVERWVVVDKREVAVAADVAAETAVMVKEVAQGALANTLQSVW